MFNFNLIKFDQYRFKVDDYYDRNLLNKQPRSFTEDDVKRLIEHTKEIKMDYNYLLMDIREFLRWFKPVADFFYSLQRATVKNDVPEKLKKERDKNE